MEAKLVNRDGAIKISVNGEILEATGFMTYTPFSGQAESFKADGTKLFFFGAYASDQGINTLAGLKAFQKCFYLGKDKFDFSETDRILESLCPEGKGVYFIPRVYLSTPTWWERENPDELCRDYRGEATRECFSSKKWREDMWSALKALIDHINSSKWRECVIGYHIAGGSTEEWTYHGHKMGIGDLDYSDCALNSFRNWLKERFTSIDALNEACQSSYSGFDQLAIPTPLQRAFTKTGALRDPKKEALSLLHAQYESEINADAILWFCQRVKEYLNNSVLTGAFYGYIIQHPRIDKCHSALAKVLASPYIDFLSTTHGGRNIWPYATAVDSIKLHGKLFVSEGDIRTCLTKTPNETIPFAVPNNSYYKNKQVWKGPATLEESLADLKRSSAKALTGNHGIWWFDMFGGAFDHPEMRRVIQKHRELMATQTLGPLKSDVAVFVDEEGLKYFSPDCEIASEDTQNQRIELSLAGIAYDIYLASDLTNPALDLSGYKCCVMLQFAHPAKEIVKAVEERLKNSGRTIIWTCFAALENSEMTDFEISYDPYSPPRQCSVLPSVFPTYSCAFKYDSENPLRIFPKKPLSCPDFSESTLEDAYILARFEGTTKACIAAKSFPTHTSIYSLLPGLPNQVLRKLMLLSGAHVYSNTSDAIIAGGKFVAMRTQFAGEKRIHFPLPVKMVTDVYSGEEMEINDIFIDFEANDKTTRLFMIET